MRLLLVLAAFFWTIGLTARRSNAQGGDEARIYVDRATAAFGLGHHAVAAENFEKAFSLRPDPALLYNAAQSHRLAGNKQRALELYESYLRMYGKKDKRQEIEARIKELKKAIEHDKAVATSPPTSTEPVEAGPTGAGTAARAPTPAAPPAPPAVAAPPAVPIPPSAPPSAPAPALVAAPVSVETTAAAPAAGHERALTSRPGFWVAVGAVVVAAVVASVLLASSAQDPTPSIGKVDGN